MILLVSSVLNFAFLLQLEASAPLNMKPFLGFIVWVLLLFSPQISGFNGQQENEDGISFEEEISTIELEHSEVGSIKDINEVGAENIEPAYKYSIVTASKSNEYENTLHPNFVGKTSHEVEILNPVMRISYPEKTGEQKHAEGFSVQSRDFNSEQRLIEPTHVHVNGVCQLGSNDEVGMKFLRVNSINGCLDPWWSSINHWNVRRGPNQEP